LTAPSQFGLRVISEICVGGHSLTHKTFNFFST
jgi:hypothetical protein